MDRRKDAYMIDFKEPLRGPESLAYHFDNDFFSEQGDEEILGGDVDLDLEIQPTSSHSYQLLLHYEGAVTVPCDRCLAPLEVEVDTDEEITVEIGEALDEENDEALVLDAADPRYDFSFIFYELIKVSLPIVHSHEDIAECDPSVVSFLMEGDAPEEMPEDPRWESLRKKISEEDDTEPRKK